MRITSRRSRPRASTSTTTRWCRGVGGLAAAAFAAAGPTVSSAASRAPDALAAPEVISSGTSRAEEIAGAERLLVTIGEVTPTSALLWARAPGARELDVELSTGDGPRGRRAEGQSRRYTAPVERVRDWTARVPLTGLVPGARYRFRASTGAESVSGQFAGAPPPADTGTVRFAWSGDLGSRGHCRPLEGGYSIFTALLRVRPDFFVFVGDTIYADHRCSGDGIAPGGDFVASTRQGFQAKHRYNRADPSVQRFFRATPVYAVWDDHEVRNDFAGTEEPLTEAGMLAFLDYWPVAGVAGAPAGLYRSFRWGARVELFILDTRRYRSPNAMPDGPGKTMLGSEQLRWLVDGVASSTATWKVVVSSVSLSIPTGRAHRDSWSNASWFGSPQPGTGFAHERDQLLTALRDRGARNVVFVVADVHHAEVIRHEPWPRFVVHELVAGPLSASAGRPRPLDRGLNPLSLAGAGGRYTYGVVEVDDAGLRVSAHDESGRSLFERTLSPE